MATTSTASQAVDATVSAMAYRLEEHIASKPEVTHDDCEKLVNMVLDGSAALSRLDVEGSTKLEVPEGLTLEGFLFAWEVMGNRYSFLKVDDKVIAIRVR